MICNPDPTKLLSFICYGRNDNYMGNFKWRLATVLNKHAQNAYILGAEHEVEVIVADWGSEVPLWQVLDLTPEARKLTKFMIVPPGLAAECNKDAIFPAGFPSNAAARRSSGKYLMMADADAYFPLASMSKLLWHLRSGSLHNYKLNESFFWGSKFHVPQEFVKENPGLEQVDAHIASNWLSYRREIVSKTEFRGVGVALLMHRDIWFATRGWDERLIYWGWNDIDWHKRLCSRYVWDDLECHGLPIFHLEHYVDRFKTHEQENPRKYNPREEPASFAPNPENWGLRDHKLEVVDGYGRPASSTESLTLKAPQIEKPSYKPVSEIIVSSPIYSSEINSNVAFDSKPLSHELELGEVIRNFQPVRVVDLECGTGKRTRFFAQWPCIKEVVAVDKWNREEVADGRITDSVNRIPNDPFKEFIAACKLSNISNKVTCFRGDILEAAKANSEASKFDLVYIPALSSPSLVTETIRTWSRLLSTRGIICGAGWSDSENQSRIRDAVMYLQNELQMKPMYHEDFWFLCKTVETSTSVPSNSIVR